MAQILLEFLHHYHLSQTFNDQCCHHIETSQLICSDVQIARNNHYPCPITSDDIGIHSHEERSISKVLPMNVSIKTILQRISLVQILRSSTLNRFPKITIYLMNKIFLINITANECFVKDNSLFLFISFSLQLVENLYPKCAYQGVTNVSFSENFEYALNKLS